MTHHLGRNPGRRSGSDPNHGTAGRLDDVRHVRGPAELIQAVPYLLGFHPSESLVLVGLGDGLLAVAARLDLADADLSDADLSDGRGRASDTVLATLSSMRRGGTERVIAVVFSDRDDGWDAIGHARPGLPWSRLVDGLDVAVADSGCVLVETLLVRDERYWSYTCASDECCPSEGSALLSVPSAFAAAVTVDGRAPLRDRRALEAHLEPLPGGTRARLRPLIAAAEDSVAVSSRSTRRRLMSAARASLDARWQAPDDDTAALFVWALREISMRDALWMAIDHRRIDGRALWRDLSRRAPAPWDVAPTFLHGWASWRAGDGAQARIAAQRALESDPGYGAADMLLTVLSQGIDPRTFPRLGRPA